MTFRKASISSGSKLNDCGRSLSLVCAKVFPVQRSKETSKIGLVAFMPAALVFMTTQSYREPSRSFDDANDDDTGLVSVDVQVSK